MVLHFFETLYRLATVTCQSLAHEIRFLAVASHKNLTENFVKLSFKAVTAKSWSVLSLSLLFYPYKYLLASLQVFFFVKSRQKSWRQQPHKLTAFSKSFFPDFTGNLPQN